MEVQDPPPLMSKSLSQDASRTTSPSAASTTSPPQQQKQQSPPLQKRKMSSENQEQQQQQQQPRLEILGTPENGLAVIYPPSDSDVVDMLRRIHQLLQNRKIQQEMDVFLLKVKDTSIRRIQGDRVEIFVEAEKKSTDCFDQVLGNRLPPNAKARILDYARRQARQDPRQTKDDYEYGNFSLITNFSACQPQAPHIDLVQPNFQFGLMVSEKAPGTLVYESEKDIRTVDQLAEHWKAMAAGDDSISSNNNNNNNNEMPPKLQQALRKDDGAKMLLDYFGNVLESEQSILSKMKSANQLPTGSLLSLPGGVVHAGPKSSTFRSVIFFSGWKRGSDVAAYDPDIQYTGTMLAGHLTSILWQRQGIGYPERLYLLQRLVQYIEGSSIKGIWGHFGAGALANFVGHIETKAYRNMFTKEQYLEEMAQNESMCVPGDPMSDPIFDPKEYEQVSEDGLFTIWDEQSKDSSYECPIIVYRRILDGKVVLRYPNDKNDGNGDEYEGHRDDEKFELIMNGSNKQERFDGSNGRLLDTDGELVKVYKGRRNSVV